MTNLYYLRFKHSHWRAERPFIRSEERVLTYADADACAAQLANALQSWQVQPGDRVMVQVEKSATLLLLYLACLRVGAVYVPLNTACTLTELEYFINDAKPSLLVCSPDKQSAVAALAAKLPGCTVVTLSADGKTGTLAQRAQQQASEFVDAVRDGSDLVAILYTSGITGRAKGAMLTHDNLASNCFTLKDCWRYSSDDVLVHVLPIFHTHGLFVATNVTLAAGASMILLPKFARR